MATYNGESHVSEQLVSILDQLGPHDEVIVVDDGSTDGTVSTIQELGDDRIRIAARAENRGYAAAFEDALQQARGTFIFLADQDDVWVHGRVEAMTRALRSSAVVVGNLRLLGQEGPVRGPFGQRDWRLTADPHRWRTLAGLAASNVPYYGSAMALRADFLDHVLPFPPSAVELHDGWLGVCGLQHRSIAHVADVVTLRRVHAANASGSIHRPRSPIRVLRGRVLFAQIVIEARRRRRGLGKYAVRRP